MKVIEQLGYPIHIYKDYIAAFNSSSSLHCLFETNLGVNLVFRVSKSNYKLAQGIGARLSRISMEHSILVLMTIKIAEEHVE